MNIVEFLTAQYDRIEVGERSNIRINMPLAARCPTCGKPVHEFTTSTTSGREVEFPCGHEMPTEDFVREYGESSPDPFVLADLESKRRIAELHGDQHECTDTRASEYPYVGCETARLLAAPFSGEPGYDKRWAV